MRKYKIHAVAGLIVLSTLAVAGDRQPVLQPRAVAGPRYSTDGKLLRPDDYRTWVFVGAELGVEYGPQAYPDGKRPALRPDTKVGDFHNIYINPEAYSHYLRTGEFPDKTMLALDAYQAEQKEPQHIVRQGRFEGKQLHVEVAVKDRDRPDGSRTPWAYYSFPKTGDRPKELAATAAAHSDSECYQCHLQHADRDNVWVQFYPTLRVPQRAAR
jgi:hypothetical protein